MRIIAVTCVKNEGPFLLEWIAFHRLIGCTDFLFYSNDCSDGTDTLLDQLAEHAIVRHIPNPAKQRNYQMGALNHAIRRSFVKQADWVWVADVDEYLNIHVGDHSIPALIEACGTPQAISLNFQFFGNCDIDEYVDEPVIAQFKRSHNPDIWRDQTAIEVKTLVSSRFPLKSYGAHRPFFERDIAKNKIPVWTDGSGREVPFKFKTAANKRRIRKFPAKAARDHATLNHYALRSLDSYLVKNDRGDVNREHRHFDDSYWRERNDDGFEDVSIQRYLPKLNEEIEALKSLPGIRDLHDASVAAHKRKRDELLAQKDYQALRDQLKAAPKLCDCELDLIKELS